MEFQSFSCSLVIFSKNINQFLFCRILQDHTSASGVHNQALESIKFKLTEAEQSLQREKESYQTAQVLKYNRT